jgi:hypothetical protein
MGTGFASCPTLRVRPLKSSWHSILSLSSIFLLALKNALDLQNMTSYIYNNFVIIIIALSCVLVRSAIKVDQDDFYTIQI